MEDVSSSTAELYDEEQIEVDNQGNEEGQELREEHEEEEENRKQKGHQQPHGHQHEHQQQEEKIDGGSIGDGNESEEFPDDQEMWRTCVKSLHPFCDSFRLILIDCV